MFSVFVALALKPATISARSEHEIILIFIKRKEMSKTSVSAKTCEHVHTSYKQRWYLYHARALYAHLELQRNKKYCSENHVNHGLKEALY